MKCHIESHGNHYYAVKKSDTGQVLASACDLSSEARALKIIRERWQYKGAIKVYIDGTARRVIDAL